MARPGEFELIARLLAPIARDPAALGLLDDAAVLDVPAGRQLVATADALVADVHFRSEDPPDAIAWKALAVNLSDVAAMGGRPLGHLLTVAWPGGLATEWIEAFCAGLGVAGERWGSALLGGDTVSTPGPLSLSITALGTVPTGKALTRAGARPGDLLCVSGPIGDAALGLKRLKAGAGNDDPAAAKYLRPEPRIDLGHALVGHATACLDISDGLVADAGHIAEVSKVALTIEAAKVPLSDTARAALASGEIDLGELLTGGDDYELLFTAADAPHGSAIGRVDAGEGVRVLDVEGQTLALSATGWRHF
ncbi:MAG: thiamine-phosphate kinase [Alphaproteobacteria bacterium]